MSDADQKDLENDKHRLMMARLEWEFEQRKKLSDQLKVLERSKQSVLAEITTKQKVLESVDPKLHAVLEAWKPLQDDLKIPFEKMKWEKFSLLLPSPLYVLYNQLKAYKEAWEPGMEVSFEGDTDKARDFAANPKSVSQVEESGEEADSDSDVEGETRGKRKRSLSLATNEKVGDNSYEAEKLKNFLKKHPLHVLLKLRLSEADWILLRFFYFTTLNIVTVTCELPPVSDAKGLSNVLQQDTLLKGLFPGDNGEKSPNEANYYLLLKNPNLDINNVFNEGGRPFMWAQRLAGLEFISSTKEEEQQPKETAIPSVSSTYVELIVSKLKKRMQTRFKLQNLVSTLEKGIIPLSKQDESQYPARIASRLAAWIPSDWGEYIRNMATENFIESETVTEASFFFYNAVIERGSARLKAAVAIPLDYPDNVPLFSLLLQWHGNWSAMNKEAVRAMEAEVNIFCQDESPMGNVLSNQLQRLCMCLDILTDADGVMMSDDAGSYQVDQGKKTEFNQEKRFLKAISGKTRDYPFRYDSKTGLFKQR